MSAEPNSSLQNFVAEVNGHQIYRDADGVRCHLWTAGVGWWGFDLSEAEARLTAESVQPPDAPTLDAVKAEEKPKPDVPRYLVTVGKLRIKLRQKQRGEWQAVEWFERGTCRGRELLVQTTDALAADAIAQDYRSQHQEDK